MKVINKKKLVNVVIDGETKIINVYVQPFMLVILDVSQSLIAAVLAA